MTIRRYRLFDICVFTVLLCVLEAVVVLVSAHGFSDQPFTLSLTPAVTALVMVRWGAFAAIPAAAGAFALCFFNGAQPVQYLIYCGGNLLVLALLPALRRMTWKALHDNVLLAMLYGLLCALLMQAGRAAAALLAGSPPAQCAGFITTDVLSALFAVLVVWICRRLDGMLEEQKNYLQRVHEEMTQAGGKRA